MKQYFLPISILIAGIMVSGTVLYTSSGTTSGNVAGSETQTQDTPSSSGGEQDLVAAVSESDHVRGASTDEARVTIIEYLDYQCHFCAQLHPTLERVINEQEDVQWVSRNFAIFGTEPAIAAECVAKLAGEDEYWDFSEQLFNNQQQIEREYFEELATGYGISESAFTQCLTEGGDAQQKVAQESQEARDAGARGTPFSVIVDNETGEMYPVSGALPYAQFVSRINDIKEG